MTRAIVLLLVILLPAACGNRTVAPQTLQRGTPCSQCRMTVLDEKLAAQWLEPGGEPRFFDDLGCLAAYLRAHSPQDGAIAYVADHSSGEWVEAARAVYGRDETLATPMQSHLFAHASDAARAADRAVSGARTVAYADVFGPAVAAEGTHGR